MAQSKTTSKSTTRKKVAYEVQGVPVKIVATSRTSIKVRDNFYTIEAQEERLLPDVAGLDMDKEWQALYDEINDIVDGQCKQIVDMFKDKNKR